MEFVTIDDIRNKYPPAPAGIKVAFKDKCGRVRIGTLRIKEINCGKKNCDKCPHKSYQYIQYRIGKKVTDKYVGKVL